MLHALLTILASAKLLFGVDCSEYLPEVTQCIDSIKSQLHFEATQEVSPLLLHAQAIKLHQQSKSSFDILKEEEATVLVRKARKIRLKANELSAAAALNGFQGQIYHRTSDGYTDVGLVRKYLRLASQQYSLAVGHFEVRKEVTEIAKCKQHEAGVLYESWGIEDVSHSVVLDKVHNAQVCSDRVRAELSVLEGLNAIENKRRLGAISTTRSGFAIALHMTTCEGMALCA